MPKSKKNQKKHRDNESTIKSKAGDKNEKNDSGTNKSATFDKNEEDLPLPDGWARMFSKTKNRHYYLYVPKKSSQWEHPSLTEKKISPEASKPNLHGVMTSPPPSPITLPSTDTSSDGKGKQMKEPAKAKLPIRKWSSAKRKLIPSLSHESQQSRTVSSVKSVPDGPNTVNPKESKNKCKRKNSQSSSEQIKLQVPQESDAPKKPRISNDESSQSGGEVEHQKLITAKQSTPYKDQKDSQASRKTHKVSDTDAKKGTQDIFKTSHDKSSKQGAGKTIADATSKTVSESSKLDVSKSLANKSQSKVDSFSFLSGNALTASTSASKAFGSSMLGQTGAFSSKPWEKRKAASGFPSLTPRQGSVFGGKTPTSDDALSSSSTPPSTTSSKLLQTSIFKQSGSQSATRSEKISFAIKRTPSSKPSSTIPSVFKNALSASSSTPSNVDRSGSLSVTPSAISFPLPSPADKEDDAEPMDAENYTEQILEVRSSLSTVFDEATGSLTEKLITSPPQAQKPEQNKEAKLYVVIDTNIFICHPNITKDLLNCSTKEYGELILVVPWMVLQELDHLKDNKGKKHEGIELQNKARKATSCLNQFIEKQHPRLQAENIYQQKMKIDGMEIECNDDRIIHCCFVWKKLYPDTTVLLLSNDNNLRTKAIANYFLARCYLDFRREYMDISSCPIKLKAKIEKELVKGTPKLDLSKSSVPIQVPDSPDFIPLQSLLSKETTSAKTLTPTFGSSQSFKTPSAGTTSTFGSSLAFNTSASSSFKTEGSSFNAPGSFKTEGSSFNAPGSFKTEGSPFNRPGSSFNTPGTSSFKASSSFSTSSTSSTQSQQDDSTMRLAKALKFSESFYSPTSAVKAAAASSFSTAALSAFNTAASSFNKASSSSSFGASCSTTPTPGTASTTQAQSDDLPKWCSPSSQLTSLATTPQSDNKQSLFGKDSVQETQSKKQLFGSSAQKRDVFGNRPSTTATAAEVAKAAAASQFCFQTQPDRSSSPSPSDSLSSQRLAYKESMNKSIVVNRSNNNNAAAVINDEDAIMMSLSQSDDDVPVAAVVASSTPSLVKTTPQSTPQSTSQGASQATPQTTQQETSQNASGDSNQPAQNPTAGGKGALAKVCDEALCELQQILLELLTEVMEKGLKHCFGKMWLEIVAYKPPWSLLDLFKILEKHPILKELFNYQQDALTKAAVLQKYLEKHQDSGADVYLKELRESVNNSIVLTRMLQRKLFLNAINRAREALSTLYSVLCRLHSRKAKPTTLAELKKQVPSIENDQRLASILNPPQSSVLQIDTTGGHELTQDVTQSAGSLEHSTSTAPGITNTKSIGPSFSSSPGPGFSIKSGPSFSNSPGPGFSDSPGPSFSNRPGLDLSNKPCFSNSSLPGLSNSSLPGLSNSSLPGLSNSSLPGLSNSPGPSFSNSEGPSLDNFPGSSRNNSAVLNEINQRENDARVQDTVSRISTALDTIWNRTEEMSNQICQKLHQQEAGGKEMMTQLWGCLIRLYHCYNIFVSIEPSTIHQYEPAVNQMVMCLYRHAEQFAIQEFPEFGKEDLAVFYLQPGNREILQKGLTVLQRIVENLKQHSEKCLTQDERNELDAFWQNVETAARLYSAF